MAVFVCSMPEVSPRDATIFLRVSEVGAKPFKCLGCRFFTRHSYSVIWTAGSFSAASLLSAMSVLKGTAYIGQRQTKYPIYDRKRNKSSRTIFCELRG